MTTKARYAVVLMSALGVLFVSHTAFPATHPSENDALQWIQALKEVSPQDEASLLSDIAAEYQGRDRVRLIDTLRPFVRDALVQDESHSSLLDKDPLAVNWAIRLIGQLLDSDPSSKNYSLTLFGEPWTSEIINELLNLLHVNWFGKIKVMELRIDVLAPATYTLIRIGKPASEPLVKKVASTDFSKMALLRAGVILKAVEGLDGAVALLERQAAAVSPLDKQRINKLRKLLEN